MGSVTREFERDNCVTSEILQSDWTIPNRAGVPRKSTKVPRPSFVRESREGLGTRLPLTDGTPNAREWQSGCDVTFISEPIKKRAKFSRGERLSVRPSAGYHAFAAGQHVHAGCQRVHAGYQRAHADCGFVSTPSFFAVHELDRSRSPTMVNILLVYYSIHLWAKCSQQERVWLIDTIISHDIYSTEYRGTCCAGGAYEITHGRKYEGEGEESEF